ncbi:MULTISPECIES: GNAT family N-acetyltransferase [unclassified Janthinobacterium]|uniref:GNAT family N-acetyltransferase n=1 Tax=unclassified Janthinobacterium TaxID=2610881 RepID=UPI0012FC8B1E|nr:MULTISPECIES: GNAT family N-acetyltransferase [unclassified Janthinobacterium]MEC5163596.1 RimJ/RimL family protein N-acetyltransferase [Janthinobacterium sp. CG_S6]
MIIRKLTAAAADAEASRALRLAGTLESPAAFWSSHEEELRNSLDAMAQRIVETPFQCVFGLFAGAELVGMAGLKREQIDNVSHRAGVWGVYVAPQARGTGAARRLMQALIAYARTLPGVVQLTLSVRAVSAVANALYAKLGFEHTGVERRSIYCDGVYYDENRMVLMLDA